MKSRSFWDKPHAFLRETSTLVRIVLIMGLVVGSLALVWLVRGRMPTEVRAAEPRLDQIGTTTLPWAITMDGSNHLWVAEPGCDPSPAVCNNPGTPGVISEYDPTTLTVIHEFKPPAIYNPFFLVLDASGNIWFSDPSHGAIGKLVPQTGTWTEFHPIAGATPWDLVFDTNGHLWFTNFQQGTIAEFNIQTNQLIGNTPTPTSGAVVYGISRSPDGRIWFAENNKPFVGSFIPPASGALPQNAITEYGVPTSQQHLITVDGNRNVWFTTGFEGRIGKLVAGSPNTQMFCLPASDQGSHLSGITVDGLGRVWFTDSLSSRIGYIDPIQAIDSCTTHSAKGITFTTLAPGAHPHDGLIADAQNNIYFTTEFAKQLGKIAASTALGPSPTATPSLTVQPTTGPLTPTPPPSLTPTPTSGIVDIKGSAPTAKTWYFSEGRVGAGFNEYLTVGNPDTKLSCIVDLHYFPENGTSVNRQITIPPASRWTEPVTQDLGTSINGPGISVAAIVSNAANSPCPGIVAERPMYFNYRGVNSGSNVVGATQTSTRYYFADIPVGGGYTSFITLLNPPGGLSAQVKVTYYANRAQVGFQSLTINPGGRGTFDPNLLKGLPRHTSAVVTSNVPIVAERSAFFLNIDGGIAGMVTGASTLLGSSQVAQEWFLAEGYTGTNASGGVIQENLLIANLDPTTSADAQVTIILEYPDGSMNKFLVTVQHNSQLIWNVNTLANGAPAKEVSADIVSTGAGIVVERQMYFRYAHTISGLTLHSTGGTEVTGQTKMSKAYTFAEGYSNKGYHEWLTLQNPTAQPETVYLTLVNGYGRIYTTSFTVGHNTRFTQDITALVLAYMVMPGDTFKAYEVSLTVQTLDGSLFVAERPMYWNTAGSLLPTQGGSDAFGYGGV